MSYLTLPKVLLSTDVVIFSLGGTEILITGKYTDQDLTMSITPDAILESIVQLPNDGKRIRKLFTQTNLIEPDINLFIFTGFNQQELFFIFNK